MEYRKTELCQLPRLGCFGCCGRKFGSKAEMEKALEQNGIELKGHTDLKKYRDRVDSDDLHHSGLCKNLIREGDRIYCPLHPLRNNGEDLRIDHCDINYLCLTAKKFNSWEPDKQKRYLDFIHRKNLDWYEYSIKTDNGEFLKEFQATEGKEPGRRQEILHK